MWLRSEGCPWDEDTCSRAARGGYFEMLKWLRSQGCPWNEWTCDEAAAWGHLEVLQWALENGCPCPEQDKKEYVSKIAEWKKNKK
jgi:hypothetical protein